MARWEQIDRRSDVYSLGATLSAADRSPTVCWVKRGRGAVPSGAGRSTAAASLVQSVPEILETITLKCLAKEQSLRYDSAKALAEDLQRYIDGEPIIARKASLWYRAGKQVRKYKSLYALSLLSLLFIRGAGGRSKECGPSRPGAAGTHHRKSRNEASAAARSGCQEK